MNTSPRNPKSPGDKAREQQRLAEQQRRRALLGMQAEANEIANKANITSDEMESLREVSKGLMQRVIPDEHRAKLIRFRFVEQKIGGLVITPLGEMLLAVRK